MRTSPFEVLGHSPQGRTGARHPRKGLSLDIPAGVSGPRMLEVVRQQLQEAMAAIPTAIYASQRED